MVISLVIPCRNASLWIQAAVNSALAQTHRPVEIIVVDDGSTDESARLAESVNPAVRVIRQAAQGGNVARNAGLAVATGEWVQFLDADDYLEAEKISRQLTEAGDALEAADVLYSPVIMETWLDGKPAGREPTRIDADADLFTRWINWQLPQTGGALWRREALLRIGGWKDDQPCCQEHELYLRALRAGLRFHHCPTPGAVYRIWSSDTVCHRDPLRVIREKTRLITSLLDWLETDSRLLPAHRRTAARVLFEQARTWARSDVRAATDYYARHHKSGLIAPVGPAAPPAYRLALRLLGFRLTESLASRLRKTP